VREFAPGRTMPAELAQYKVSLPCRRRRSAAIRHYRIGVRHADILLKLLYESENRTMPLMTPEHPRWAEFTNRLGGPEGCDFREDNTWRCHGGHDKRFATAILEDMAKTEDINVAGSLAYYDQNGGHCDCEILFNVDPYEIDESETPNP
jgi:hypothetical protein